MNEVDEGRRGSVQARWMEDGPNPVTAGTDPPPAPSDGPDEVERCVDEVVDGGCCQLVRIALAEASEDRVRQVLSELRAEVTVLGSSHGRSVGPEDPAAFDVALAPEYDPSTVVDALVRPDEVVGATVVEVRVVTPDGPEEAGEADVADAVPGVESDAGGQRADPDDLGGAAEQPSGAESTGASSDGTEAVGALDADPALRDTPDAVDDGANASHPAFEQFKMDVDPVGYENLLDELESTSIPGEFGDSADLTPLLEDDAGSDGPGESDRDGGVAGDVDEPRVADGDVDVPPVTDGDVDVPRVADGDSVDPQAPSAVEVPPSTVVDALVTALEEDAISGEQRRALADALDGRQPKTMQVKLDHLQREIDEMTAYKDAMESFIEEYGGGDELVEQVRAAMEAFATDVQRIGATVQGLQEALEATDGRLDDHDQRLARTDDRLASTDDRLDGVGERVDRVDSRCGAHAERLDDLQQRVEPVEDLQQRVATLEELEDSLDALAGDLDALQEEVAATDADGAAGERLDAVDESLADLEDRVAAVESETTGAIAGVRERLDAVEGQMDDLQGRMAEQEAWRERFQSLLVSGTPDDDADQPLG